MTSDLTEYTIVFERTARKSMKVTAPNLQEAWSAIEAEWGAAVMGEDSVQLRNLGWEEVRDGDEG